MTRRFSQNSATTIVLAALLLALAPAAARGQAFAFSVGSGGGHHHHHHSGWSFAYGYGPWWGPAYYAPPPIVYAPPPVVQPIYIQPQTIAPVPTPGISPYTSNAPATSAVAASPTPANSPPSLVSSSTDDRIVIRNMAGAQLPVSFLVDGQDVELSDGATRTFIGKPHRTIQYDRGGRYGSTQQDLTGGQYEFRITATGWDLVRKPDATPSSRTAVRANSLPEVGGVSR